MAQPPAYNRTHDFTLDEKGDVDTASLNAEYDNVALTVNKIRECLALLQNDDGSLRAGVIKGDAIGKELTKKIDELVNEALKQAQAAVDAANKAANSATEAVDDVTEEGTKQLEAVRAEGTKQLEAVRAEGTKQLQSVTAEGDAQIERIELSGGQGVILAGSGCYERYWTLPADTTAGTNIAIPSDIRYIVGRHHFRVSWNGLVLAIGQNFTEVGAEDTFSDTFRLTFDAKAGDELDIWIGALGKGDVSQAIALAGEASAAVADLSRKVVYKEEV